MWVLLTGYYSHKQTVCIVIVYINFYSCKVINIGRHGRKSRAASPKRKRGESTDQSQLSDLNDILESQKTPIKLNQR